MMMLGWKRNDGWKKNLLGLVMLVLSACFLFGVMEAQQERRMAVTSKAQRGFLYRESWFLPPFNPESFGNYLITRRRQYIGWMENVLWFKLSSGYPTALNFSPDGTFLVSSISFGKIGIFRIPDGTLNKILESGIGVTVISLSPNGKLLACGGRGNFVRIYQFPDGQEVQTLNTGWISSLAFSPDSSLLAIGVGTEIKIWRVNDWNIVHVLKGHTATIQSISFDSSGNFLASASWDKSIKIWRISDGQLIRTLTGHTDVIWSIMFSPDNNFIASGSIDGEVRLWNANNGITIWRINHGSTVRKVLFYQNGEYLIVGGDVSIKIYKSNNGSVTKSLDLPGVGLDIRPQNDMIATNSWSGIIKVLWTNNWQIAKIIELDTAWAYSVIPSIQRNTLFVGDNDGKITLWRLSDGMIIKRFQAHERDVGSIALSHDSTLLASCGYDGSIKLWRAEDGTLIKTLLSPWQDYAGISVVFSPNGQLLAVGMGDGSVRVYSVDGQLIKKFIAANNTWIFPITFSPDGQYLVTGDQDGNIKWWRSSDFSLFRILSHGSGVASLAFSADGTLLASGGNDGVVKIWNTTNGVLLKTLTGHIGWVWSMAFTRDSNFLITGEEGGLIRFYRTSDWNPVMIKGGHAVVRCVAVSSNLLASSGDGIALWLINPSPSVPVLLSPANNATVSPTPTFKVKSIDPNGDNVKYVIEVTSGNDARTFETGFYPSGQEATYIVPSDRQLSAGQWSWRAKAIDSKGLQSGWSQSQTFIVNVTNNPPSTPVLLFPVNQTVSPVPAFKLKSDDPDNDQVMFIMEVKQGGILKPFQTGFYSSGVEVTYSDSKQPLSDGQWQWRAKARDKRGAESGWSEWKTFTVQSNLPDLVPIDLKVTPDTVRLGNKVTVSFKVLNQGKKRANASKTRIILSKSASEPSSSDPLLKELSTPALDPNKSQDHSESVVIPADIQTGDYYVWVVVDVDKTSGQGDDTNDKAKFPIKVQEKLDYDVLVVEEVVRKEGGKEIIEEKPVAGARIIVFDENHNIITEDTTNREGKVKIPALKVGHYIRAEKYITTFYLNDKNEAVE
jgi:WD40 repeat protein